MSDLQFDWTNGISCAEASRVLAAVMDAQLLSDRPALLLHNLDMLADRINFLQKCFPPQTLHALAIKANPLPALLRFVVGCGMGLEAASLEEVALARAAACPPERIVFDSPAKTRQEITQAWRWGVTINADNLSELERIAVIIADSPESQSLIGLRINPQIGPGEIPMLSVSGRYSKFGVPLTEKRQEIIAAFRRYPWLRSLHLHIGSQGNSLEQMVAAVTLIFELRDEIHASLGKTQVETVDIGGGLPWCYQLEHKIATPQDYAALLATNLPVCFQNGVRLITEFGRAVQAGCGFAASKVEYVKTDAGRRTAVIHFGADLFLRRVYRPSEWQHRISVLAADASLKTCESEPHTLAGPLCFAGDILAENLWLPRVEEGDWIILHDSGAYTLSLWSRHCNRGLPPVFGYTDRPLNFHLLYRGEQPEDVVRFWDI
jgi:diaminopimelate decarboxylase